MLNACPLKILLLLLSVKALEDGCGNASSAGHRDPGPATGNTSTLFSLLHPSTFCHPFSPSPASPSPASPSPVFFPGGLISITSEVLMLHMERWQDSKYSRKQREKTSAAQHALSNAVRLCGSLTKVF